MSDDKTSDIVRAVTEVAKAVPIYPDAIQPGAKQAGRALETVGRAVNAALAPIRGLVWGVEQLEEFLANRVKGKLKNTPPDQIVTPKPNVVAPALDAVRFTNNDPDLQEAYANLIASAMTDRMRDRVFPSFVEILKQLTSDEAKMLRVIAKRAPVPIVHLRREDARHNGVTVARNLSLIATEAGCQYPYNVQSYLDNLDRLGIVDLFPEMNFYTDENVYVALESDTTVLALKASIPCSPEETVLFRRSGLELTTLGNNFIEACVKPYEERQETIVGVST